MLDVKELQQNTEFMDWLYKLNSMSLRGEEVEDRVTVKDLELHIEFIRKWTSLDLKYARLYLWYLIHDVIQYRVAHKANGHYMPGAFEWSVPDVYADAVKKVTGSRNRVYGHPWSNFSDIATLVRQTGGNPNQTPVDVALDIMCVKVGRLMHTPDHYDSLVDLVGYCLCLFQLFDYMENETEKRRDTEKIEKPEPGNFWDEALKKGTDHE